MDRSLKDISQKNSQESIFLCSHLREDFVCIFRVFSQRRDAAENLDLAWLFGALVVLFAIHALAARINKIHEVNVNFLQCLDDNASA